MTTFPMGFGTALSGTPGAGAMKLSVGVELQVVKLSKKSLVKNATKLGNNPPHRGQHGRQDDPGNRSK